MVRIRFRSVALLVASLAIGLAAGACKKDEKKTDTASPGEIGREGRQDGCREARSGPWASARRWRSTPTRRSGAAARRFRDRGRPQLPAAPAEHAVEEVRRAEADGRRRSAKLAEFKDKCGFDPMAAVKSVSIGLKGVGGKASKPEGAIVIHGPDKAKVMACIEKMKAEAAKDGRRSQSDGWHHHDRTKDGGKFGVHVRQRHDVARCGRPQRQRSRASRPRPRARSALKTLAGVRRDVLEDQHGRLAVVAGQRQRRRRSTKAAQMGFKPKAVFGSVNVTDGLTLDLRMRLDDGGPGDADRPASRRARRPRPRRCSTSSTIANDGADVEVLARAVEPEAASSAGRAVRRHARWRPAWARAVPEHDPEARRGCPVAGSRCHHRGWCRM